MALVAATASAARDPPAPQQVPGSATTRVEVQMGLCAPPGGIERSLRLSARGAPIEVWLFDDNAHALFDRGLRIRLRVAKNSRELTLKVANQDCATLPSTAIPRGEGKCEYDMHGDTIAGAASLTRALNARSADDLVAGRISLAQVLGPAQIAYLRDIVHLWPLPDDLRALGPIRERNYRPAGKPYDLTVATLPAGEAFVEISIKVPVADVERASARMQDHLASAGVPACADQSAQAVNKLRSLLR